MDITIHMTIFNLSHRESGRREIIINILWQQASEEEEDSDFELLQRNK